MGFLNTLYSGFEKFTSWLWGWPLLVILVGGGIMIAVVIKGIQFRHLGFIFKTTVGTALNKEIQNAKKAKGVSPLQGCLAAVSATVGTGNIVGVGAAIAVGGPGALFWMWICGFVAMGIKYAEVTLSCQYRQKKDDGSYRAGPYMYMKDGVHSKILANIFGVMMLVTMAILCSVHGSALSENLGNLGVNKIITTVVLTVIVAAIAWGGMKLLVKVTDKLVPIMSIFYCIFSLIVIFANITHIGSVFASIFKGAFTSTAAVGGFTGAGMMLAMRQGLARGVFSNDAGLGLSASVQAQVEDIGHPAQQGTWAIIETFIDTILLCTMTGLVILFSGVWTSGHDGSVLASEAMGSVMGPVGKYACVIGLVLFGISSLITDVEGVNIQAKSMWDSKVVGRLFQVIILVLVIVGCLVDISSILTFLDFANGIVLILNVPAILILYKVLKRLTSEYFDNKGDLSKIKHEVK